MKIKQIKIESVDEYFALPKEKREYKGFYRVPFALPSSLFPNKEGEKGWEDFYKEIKKRYPIQYFFREYLTSIDNPLMYIWKIKISAPFFHFKYAVKRFFNPILPRWRKTLKRHQYSDICEIIRTSNFNLILDFYYEEVVDGVVDWNADDLHQKAYKEIIETVKWIEEEREKAVEKSYELLDKSNRKYKEDGTVDYKSTYKEHDELESFIKNKDTEILKWMIDNRDFFWT